MSAAQNAELFSTFIGLCVVASSLIVLSIGLYLRHCNRKTTIDPEQKGVTQMGERY